MAKDPTFTIEDVERLFRALVPSGQPDPFGRIERLILSLAEEEAKDQIITDQHREEILEELASIKARTFGILFLQIFRTLKFFLGLLPQGRLILIVIAGIGLLTVLLDEGEVSGQAIRDAVAQTGLAKFIDRILEELGVFTNAVADRVQELSNLSAGLFVSVAGAVDAAQVDLAQAAQDLISTGGETEEAAAERIRRAHDAVTRAANRLLPAGNAAANGADLVGPALRGIHSSIREIPGMALKLVRL